MGRLTVFAVLLSVVLSVNATIALAEDGDAEQDVQVNGFFEKGMVGTPKAPQPERKRPTAIANTNMPGMPKNDPRVAKVKERLREVSKKRLEQAEGKAISPARPPSDSFFPEQTERSDGTDSR